MEEEIVFSLFELVAPRHELRSAFADRRVRGWIYLEATMNKDLGRLLKITAGVISTRCGLVYQRADHSEGLKLLKMTSDMQVGKWVKVQRGIYKGDVGHVVATRGSSVELLLVPRLPSPKSVGKNTQTHSAPALFDHDTIKQVHGTEPVRIDEKVYSFQGETFEYGLIIKHYDFDSVSTTVSSMPLDIFSLFRDSLHPGVIACGSTFPKPFEWCFAEGDEVLFLAESYRLTRTPAFAYSPPKFKSGTISEVRADSVDLATKEGIVKACWLEICKVVHVGDYVEITGGTYQGKTGWVVGVRDFGILGVPGHNQVASIILHFEEKDALLSDGLEVCQILKFPAVDSCSLQIETHVNLLKHAVVPHVLGTHPHLSNAIPRSERIPWINTAVIVTGRHSMRTYPGIVKDVLPGQQTPSGLKIQIEPTCVDPNRPFTLLTLDYDNVVEARYFKCYSTKYYY